MPTMEVTRFGMGSRRAALDTLARVMDATALEDLFTGTDEEAAFVYDLLSEAARGRGASCYWEVCRTARRRGVAPEYVADRAAILLASIEERRRSDLYRVLGVEPLAGADALRRRWLEIAKQEHPDVGGDPQRFRQAKNAYELLKDAERRAEYERYWLRALGPFERVAQEAADQAAGPADDGSRQRVVLVGRRAPVPARAERGAEAPGEAATAPEPASAPPDPGAELRAVARVLDELRALAARVDPAELDRARRMVTERIEVLERIRAEFETLGRVKRALPG